MRLLLLAAVIEGATGIGLISQPVPFARILFGTELSAGGVAIGRFAGIPLVTVALLCWPWPALRVSRLTIVRAFLTYNVLATIYLTSLGISGMVGTMLWPAVAIHAVFAALFTRSFISLRSATP